MMPLVAELSAPALLAAGLAASPHCALMCGALNAMQLRARGTLGLREAQLWLHGGRVLGYAALGALTGGLGGALIPALPQPQIGRAIQALAAVALILVGLLQFRAASARVCCEMPSRRFGRLPARPRLLLQGLLWAALPCGMLYGVLLLAGFSGNALSGALLVAAFGLGTTPLVWSSAQLAQMLAHRSQRRALRYGAGIALVLLGVISAAATLGQGSDLLAWCAAHV